MRLDALHTYNHTPLHSVLLSDPPLSEVQAALDAAREHANTAARKHKARILDSFDAQAEGYPRGRYGLIVRDGGGATAAQLHYHRMPTSQVGLAWWQKGPVRWVRIWGKRANAEQAPEGSRTAYSAFWVRPPRAMYPPHQTYETPIWRMVFPERYARWEVRSRARLRRHLLRYLTDEGQAETLLGEVSEVLLHLPGVGLVLRDHRFPPKHCYLVYDSGSMSDPPLIRLPSRFARLNTRVYHGCLTTGQRLHRAIEYARRNPDA